MSDELEDAMGDALGRVRRDVEAAVRIPPYELVLRRHHRRRRRAVGAGGVALAAVVAAGFAVAPAVRDHRAAVTPTSVAHVSIAPPQGPGTLSLSDVSFADASQGALVGRRCAATCRDVVAGSTDGGQHYGTEVTLPGSHRYVAVVGDGTELAYGPDLAISEDHGATWHALDAPAPVADVSVQDGTALVLLTPAGSAAELFSGPVDATGWSAFTSLGSVTGSNATARLLRPSATSVLVVSDSAGVPTVATATLGAKPPIWSSRQLAVCGAGAVPSVSAASATTWWVACEGQRDAGGAEAVALTTDGGSTYTDISPAAGLSSGTTEQVTAVSASTAYLSGGSALLVTTNGGQTWTVALQQPGLATPHVPFGVGGADVWVVQPGTATIWRTTGGGVWTGLKLR